MKRIPLLLACALCAFASPLVLKNEFLELAVESKGGRVTHLAWPGKVEEVTAGDGLLGDNFHHVEQAKFFLTGLPYQMEKEEHGVFLSANHRGGGIDFMRLGKRITLAPGETVVHVTYDFHNLSAAMAANEYAFWSQNFINGASGNVNAFFPESQGITRVPVKNAGLKFAYYKQPSRGWCGFAREEGGGMAMAMDYKLLQQFYGWYGGSETTQEFYFDKIRIPQGESVTTDIELILFPALKRISGAGGGLVGELSFSREGGNSTNQAIRLSLYSGRKQKVKLVFTRRLLRDGKPVKISERTVDFKATEIKEIGFSHNFKAFPALFDIECRAYAENGALLAIFNEPLGLGASTISYRMLPQENRPGKTAPEIDLQKFDNSRQTPHIEWAKPLAGGKIRMIALTPYTSYREVAELAQRLDVEILSTLFVAQGRPQNATGDYFGLLSEADINHNINDLLQKEADVILLAGVNLEKLTPGQRQEILRKVENGCGLILTGSAGQHPDIKELVPFKPSTQRNYPRSVPVRVVNHFMTTTVPWNLIPATTCVPYENRGEMLVKVGNYPYLAVSRHGKGMIVQLSYICSGGEGRMVSGLTPQLDYPLPKSLFHEYQEIYQLMFAKLIAGAAGRDKGCCFDTLSATRNGLRYTVKLTLKNRPENGGKHTVTLVAWNRDSEELTRAVHEIDASVESYALTLPAKAWNGQTLIQVTLRNPAGEVLDFGGVTSTRLPMARIHSLTADKTHYQEGEEAVFTLKAAVEQRPAEYRWFLKDAYGRLVNQGRAEAQNAASFTVPIRSSLASRYYTFTCEMWLNGAPVDRHLVKFTATPEKSKRVWDDFEAGIWITPYTYDALRPWLHGFFADSLRQMHIRNIMGNSRVVDQVFAMNNNFNPSFYQSSGMRPARVPKEYNRTQNKMLLVRKPCLSSPAFQNQMRTQFEALGKKNAAFGNRFYWFGDELSLTGYWSSPIDFCFSPDCMKAFRLFLKKKYGTPQKAAEQWGTNFTSFEQFIPETYPEARQRKDGNYSAWADHLEFMDQLLCEYIGIFLHQGLKKGDADAIGFISGPQGPSAYGGNSWDIQSLVHDGLMSYTIGGLDEIIHSFNPNLVDIPWILGYAHYDEKVCYNLWKALQHRVNGAMGFSMASLVRPDGTLSRSGQAVARYLPEITEGFGKLVLNPLKMPPSPEIVILYSQPSIRAAYIRGMAKRHTDLRLKYIQLCRNYGIPFRFISPAEIESGLLQKTPSVKLLILADAQALGDKTLEKCAAWQAAGGHLLLEGAFAELDASCRTLKNRPLAEKIASQAIVIPLDDSYSTIFAKPGAMRSTTESKKLENQRRLFGEALAKSGITPFCRLLQKDGKPFLEAEMEIFEDPQKNRYVMAVCKEQQAVELEAKFASSAIVRNIRQKGNLLFNGNPFFFALLPEEEATAVPEVTASPRNPDGSYSFTVNCHIKRDTVLRVTLRNPKGEIVPHYGTNLLAPGGKASFSWTPALNDTPGDWKIEFREIVGGKLLHATIKL